MDTLLRFGTGDRVFFFERENQVSLNDNFTNVLTRTSRLPGVDGGFDEFGDDKSPNAVGNVSVSFWVKKNSLAEMTRRIRELDAMVSWGVSRLYKQPTDPNEPELFADARVDNISRPQHVLRSTHRQINISMDFQIRVPGWLVQGTESFLWGDGTAWSSGATWGGTAVPISVVGVENSFSVQPLGNALTWPRILIVVPSGKSAENIRVQRIVASQVVDEVSWATTLAADDRLLINARKQSVTLNGANAYGADFAFVSGRWFGLQGGLENDIRVLMDNPTDEIEITFKYFERYL